jgi:hypothetical protein
MKGLVGQLAAEKKKTVTVLCLIGVMAVLWIRVLTKKSPETAGAEIAAQSVNKETPSAPELKISFVELPKVAGRNDVIRRDVFDSENWRHFIEGQRKRGGFEEVKILSSGGNEEAIKKLAEKLKLEAILVSDNPQAFVNGDLIEVGDKMIIGDGVDAFECDVVTIEENTVILKCREAEIILKLEQESVTDS